MYEELELPDFLRASNTAGGSKTPIKRVRRPKEKKQDWRLPKNMDATYWLILREQEAHREAKKKARLAALREGR